jgi:hypothetical protein
MVGKRVPPPRQYAEYIRHFNNQDERYADLYAENFVAADTASASAGRDGVSAVCRVF